MTTTRVRIGLLPTAQLRLRTGIDIASHQDHPHPFPPDDQNNYWAYVIMDGGRCYYRVDGTTVEIDADQVHKVISNPSLHYFSTALKLHCDIKRAREQGLTAA